MSDETSESNEYLQRFAFASLVMGIISIVLSLSIFWFGSLCGIIGLAFGIIALYKNEGKREHAIWGIVTSCIGLLIPTLLILILVLGSFIFVAGVL